MECGGSNPAFPLPSPTLFLRFRLGRVRRRVPHCPSQALLETSNSCPHKHFATCSNYGQSVTGETYRVSQEFDHEERQVVGRRFVDHLAELSRGVRRPSASAMRSATVHDRRGRAVVAVVVLWDGQRGW